MTSEEVLQKQKQIEEAKKKKEIEKERKKIRQQKRAEREKQQEIKKKTKETKRKTPVRKSTREKKMKVIEDNEETCGICGQEWEDITEEEELWLDCGMCGGWFHAKCIGYNDREDLDDINCVCDTCT